MSDLAAAFSFQIAYLGIAAAQTFTYSKPQIILNNPWLVLFVVSFTIPLGFFLVEKL